MSYGFWDGVADFFTGGAYSATKATVTAAVDLGKEIFDENGQLPTCGGGGPVSVSTGAQPAPCCPQYQLVGDFLLETMTGRVWRYDDQDHVFDAVPKRVTPLIGVIMTHKMGAAKAATFEEAARRLADAYPKDQAAMSKEILRELITAADQEVELIKPR